AERLRRAVADHTFELPDGSIHRQTISLGVAALDNAMADVTDLLEAADRKLYASKHAGRNRVTS
ncbi:MAG: diguanylate cyclase, partial [Burkholderiales bacterium]|nr:diguanylate cyclase [Burkholderiales bacterium]